MSKPEEDLKTIMITCHNCNWSFASDKKECPMCGSNVVINEKELIRILKEYSERQGIYSTKRECENFLKKFKKNKKHLPTIEDLWDTSMDFVKIQKKSKEEKENKDSKKFPTLEEQENSNSNDKKDLEEIDYKICPTCGSKNKPTSKFCLEDGTPLE